MRKVTTFIITYNFLSLRAFQLECNVSHKDTKSTKKELWNVSHKDTKSTKKELFHRQ
jgi:hypothetical protein